MSINPAYVEDTDGEHAHSELEDSGNWKFPERQKHNPFTYPK